VNSGFAFRIRRAILFWQKAACAIAVLTMLALAADAAAQSGGSSRPARLSQPRHIRAADIEAYDSKAEPVANVTSALVVMNLSGWQLLHKYLPRLNGGGEPENGKARRTLFDGRFEADHASEDALNSPVPLLSVVASLPDDELSGHLKALHRAVVEAIGEVNYSAWTTPRLRAAVDSLTSTAKTAKGVRYSRAKGNLSLKRSIQLYAMTVELLDREPDSRGNTIPSAPDMADFARRLRHQIPRPVDDQKTVGFFLYRPGLAAHPVSKDSFEERADVVLLSRNHATFHVQQFPVYLTAEQKHWSPNWIEPDDEINDRTLSARKAQQAWTRLDGPYLWYRDDQLNGAIVYTADITVLRDGISIQGDRNIEIRGAVRRAVRPADYDPLHMSPFVSGNETAQAENTLLLNPPELEDQIQALGALARHYDLSFPAHSAYGTRAGEMLDEASGSNAPSSMPPDFDLLLPGHLSNKGNAAAPTRNNSGAKR
jgi:hypothetical protein